MVVSHQRNPATTTQGLGAERGARARTRRLMLDAAIALMQSGLSPSVTGVAEIAGVSRATAYRYFPSEAALVHAVVDEALGPILEWTPSHGGAGERVADLLATAIPRVEEFEATFKASLRLSLDQWAQRRAGTLGSEPLFTRGHRVDLLMNATAPLAGKLTHGQHLRVAQALSMVFGIEVLNVLKDIWGLTLEEAQGVAQWAAAALINAAEAEAINGQSAKNNTATERTQDASVAPTREVGD
ncbi:TetR/AcrR family transcriptional regulator [Devosia sp.]|uniref:TetR/AcrR family transcriptional regulator n=1 Tax=Devosia sp. TaxID=1871048 RepID=UPI002FCAA0A9